jgi:hypothetical protein
MIIIVKLLGFGGMVQVVSACLANRRPWVQTPILQKTVSK